MSLKTVTVRNFLRELRGTGSLYECHSKHPPTSRSPWRGHRQWDFSILLAKFLLSSIPSSSEALQSGIYWNTCGFSPGGAQNLWCWGVPAVESCHTWLPNISALEAMDVHGPFCTMGPRCQAVLLWRLFYAVNRGTHNYTPCNHPQSGKTKHCNVLDNFSSPQAGRHALSCQCGHFQAGIQVLWGLSTLFFAHIASPSF